MRALGGTRTRVLDLEDRCPCPLDDESMSSERRARTFIPGFRVQCPAIERPPNSRDAES